MCRLFLFFLSFLFIYSSTVTFLSSTIYLILVTRPLILIDFIHFVYEFHQFISSNIQFSLAANDSLFFSISSKVSMYSFFRRSRVFIKCLSIINLWYFSFKISCSANGPFFDDLCFLLKKLPSKTFYDFLISSEAILHL